MFVANLLLNEKKSDKHQKYADEQVMNVTVYWKYKGGKNIKIINLSIATRKNACEKERFKFRNLINLC